MRIEIRDSMGYCHVISSTSPALVGEWFAEQAEALMSASTQFNHPLLMDVWPATEHERLVIGQHSLRPVTQAGLLKLAEHLLNAAEKLGDLERTEP